jgi:ankyrin repeat protein
MNHNNNNRAHLTPDRSPVRQTRSSSAIVAAAAAAAAATPTATQSNGIMTRNRAPSTSSAKRKAAAASLSNINTDTPPLTNSRKRRRIVRDEIEVQMPNSRSRESSASTSISIASTGRSSSSMPPPSSLSPPNTSPLLSSKPPDNKKINRKNQAGETLLHRAAAAGKVDEVRDLIERGALINVQCNAGWTPLHKASLKGYVEIVQLLSKHGAKTDIQSTDEHDTPLHDACSNGHLKVVQVLLEHGANPCIQNVQGSFPHENVKEGNVQLEKLITEAYNSFKEKRESSGHEDREDSEPPLSPAMKRQSRRASTASDTPFTSQTHSSGRPKRGGQSGRDDFLARDIVYRDKDRRGHLHLNALHGNAPMVADLLRMGASALAKDRDGNTPLHLGARGGHIEVVKVLLDFSRDLAAVVNAVNKQNETPIHEVAGRGHKDVVETLLFYGADPSLKDSRGRTALDVAMGKSSTAAPGEIDLLQDWFIKEKVELPPMTENDHVDVKLEDVDMVAKVVRSVEYEPPEAAETTGTNETEIVVERQPTTSPRELTPSEKVASPDNQAAAEDPILLEIEPSNEAKDPTSAPGDATASTTPMEEVIRQERGPAPASTEEAIPPILPGLENARTPHEVDDSPEQAPVPSAPSSPKTEEPPSPPAVPEPTEEPMFVEARQPELDRIEPDSPEQMAVDEVVEEENPQESEVEVHPAEEPREPSPPPPEPQWKKLASLDSLDTLLQKEISQLLPIYTMNFHNGINSTETFVAHAQICSLLGFTTNEFFEKCAAPITIVYAVC